MTELLLTGYNTNQSFTLQQQDVGMDGPLVDTEGFPRADIDVYSVRHARHGIICEYYMLLYVRSIT